MCKKRSAVSHSSAESGYGRVRPDRLRPLPSWALPLDRPPPDRPQFRPKFFFFFPSPAPSFVLFFSLWVVFSCLSFSLWGVVSCLHFSLWGSSRVLLSLTGGRFVEFGGVFEGVDPHMCTFGLSGCRVKPRRPAAGAPLFSGFGPTLRGSTPNRAKIGPA